MNFLNGIFYHLFFCFVCLLHNPAGAIDWVLSLMCRFASAYLVLFVLFGTSSSSTRLQQLSWEWRGPLGMPGLLLPGPLSQHVFVTGTPHKPTLRVTTVIWIQIRETLSNMVVSRLWRCHRLTDIRSMLTLMRLDLAFGCCFRSIVAVTPLLFCLNWFVPLLNLEVWACYRIEINTSVPLTRQEADLNERLSHNVDVKSPPCAANLLKNLHPHNATGVCPLLHYGSKMKYIVACGGVVY